MKSLERKKQLLSEELSALVALEDRFEYLLERADALAKLPQELHREEFRVPGCQAKLWLVPSFREEKCYFSLDSDSKMVKGIAALLAELYSGEKPQDILSLSPDFLAELGIREHLSFNRRNALSSMYQRIADFARSILQERILEERSILGSKGSLKAGESQASQLS